MACCARRHTRGLRLEQARGSPALAVCVMGGPARAQEHVMLEECLPEHRVGTAVLLERLRRFARLAHRAFDHPTLMQQWDDRARQFGVRAVLNLGHSEAEIPQVTERQRRELYPLFRAALRGDERLILDFGCGPGRFTADLAEMIKGRAIGVDPIRNLLDLAPPHPSVEYRLMLEGRIPLESASVDVVWICLVLGGIHGRTLGATVSELRRVMKSTALLFLVENTATGAGDAFWACRSVDTYRSLLAPISLTHIGDYHDLGERISVMVGRAPGSSFAMPDTSSSTSPRRS